VDVVELYTKIILYYLRLLCPLHYAAYRSVYPHDMIWESDNLRSQLCLHSE